MERLRLIEKRAINTRTRRLMPHATSRHVDVGEDKLIHPDGSYFAQGSLFPASVNPGVLTLIENLVQSEWNKWRAGIQSVIREVKDAGGSKYVRATLGKYGVKEVTAFIREGQVCTVFPSKTIGTNFIMYRGERRKKI